LKARARRRKTPIGNLPAPDALDLSGLDLPDGNLRELLEVDVAGWKKEVEDTAASYARYDNKLPKTLTDQLDGLRKRLG